MPTHKSSDYKLSNIFNDILFKRIGYYDEKPKYKSLKYEIKKSTIKNANNGLFALEFIPKGTILAHTTHDLYISDKHINYINDLAYNGSIIDYNTSKNIIENINLGYIIQPFNSPMVEMFNFFWSYKCNRWTYAIRNIQKGEELSKYYGLPYWYKFELQNKNKINI